MTALVAFIRLGRPLFLGGGLLLYALGAAVAHENGHALDPKLYLLGQFVVSAFQLMTHYANDYFDYETDRRNQTPTRWSGGSRVLVAGVLPRRTALIAAIVLAAIGLGATLALWSVAGSWAAVIAIAILIMAWEYSAPPLRLAATGIGEIDTAIVVTVLVPLLGFYLQAPDLAGLSLLLLAVVPLALLQFAMLIAIEFPDASADAETGKRTLVVRLGAERAARLYAGVTAAAYLWLPIARLGGLPLRVGIAAALAAPVAIWRIWCVGCRAEHRKPRAFGRLGFFAVALLAATAAAELAAFLV